MEKMWHDTNMRRHGNTLSAMFLPNSQLLQFSIWLLDRLGKKSSLRISRLTWRKRMHIWGFKDGKASEGSAPLGWYCAEWNYMIWGQTGYPFIQLLWTEEWLLSESWIEITLWLLANLKEVSWQLIGYILTNQMLTIMSLWCGGVVQTSCKVNEYTTQCKWEREGSQGVRRPHQNKTQTQNYSLMTSTPLSHRTRTPSLLCGLTDPVDSACMYTLILADIMIFIALEPPPWLPSLMETARES